MKKVLPLLFLSASLLQVKAQVAPPQTLQEAKPELAGMSSERLQRLDRVMQEYIDKGYQGGIGVLIVRNGKVVHHKAFGYANPDTKEPLKRDAIFRIASQTKAIVSMGLMTLYEEGKFLLDDPVSKYIPAFKNPVVLDKYEPKDTTYTTVPAKREITIRQLLTHTSGISYPSIGSKEAVAIYAKNNVPSGIGTPTYKLADVMGRLGKLPLMHQPGEKWTYGLSTDVVGYLIEVISGQPLDQFLKTRLFDPLGMNDTYFYLPVSKQNRLSPIYTEGPDKSLQVEKGTRGVSPDYPKATNGTYFSGGAGLSSTMYDYAIFLQMLLNGGEYNGKRILSPITVRTVLSNQIGDLSLGQDKFGLGFSLASDKSEARIPVSEGSFAWGGYFGTTYWADPKEKVIGLIYTQKVPNSYPDLGDKFKILLYQAITASYAR